MTQQLSRFDEAKNELQRIAAMAGGELNYNPQIFDAATRALMSLAALSENSRTVADFIAAQEPMPADLAQAAREVCDGLLKQGSDKPNSRIDWEEMDRLDAFGTFGGRIVPYNGVWKIMLNETNCELWSLKTHAEAEAKFADAIKKSGYSDEENPLVELARLKAAPSANELRWREVSPNNATRGVAWIDEHATHVAVVQNDRRYLLELPKRSTEGSTAK